MHPGVKENRPTLFAQLDAPGRDETSNEQISTVRTGERPTAAATRSASCVQPLATGHVKFLYAAQAPLIERHTTGRGDGKTHAIAELGITTAPARSPMRPFPPGV